MKNLTLTILSLLLIHSFSNAAIVYTDVSPDQVIKLTPNGSTHISGIDLDSDGIKDISLENWSDISSNIALAEIQYNNFNLEVFGDEIIGRNTGGVSVIHPNTTIYSSLNFINIFSYNNPNSGIVYKDQLIDYLPWIGQSFKCIGFRIKNPTTNDYNYGWIGISFSNDYVLTVHSYAYESTPNTPIMAGDDGLVNNAPTLINLTPQNIDENEPIGTLIGLFITEDKDIFDTHIFSLVSGIGSQDNDSFSISNDTLKSNVVFDFETKSTYSIRVRVDDKNGGTFEKQFIIYLNNINDTPPTDITLSNNTINENQSTSTTIGTLSSTDPDANETHTYSLVSGSGDDDNASFTIDNNTLKSAEFFDFEMKSSYSIRIQTDDGNGGTFKKQFTININDVNDAPNGLFLVNLNGEIDNTIDEGESIGSIVTYIGVSDDDQNDFHTFSLVSGDGDNDNDQFTIDAFSLKSNEVFDFETKSSYSIRVKTDDGNGGTFEKQFTININDIAENNNNAPTDITLDNNTIDENKNANSVIGNLSTTDPDANDTHTYSLVSGSGDDDNASFTIDNNTLKSAEVFDFEMKSSYSIRIQTDDGNGGTYEQIFTINVNDIHNASLESVANQSIQVFPNPANSILHIQGVQPNSTIRLISPTGVVVHEQKNNSSNTIANISELPTGLYWLIVSDSNNAKITRMVTIE